MNGLRGMGEVGTSAGTGIALAGDVVYTWPLLDHAETLPFGHYLLDLGIDVLREHEEVGGIAARLLVLLPAQVQWVRALDRTALADERFPLDSWRTKLGHVQAIIDLLYAFIDPPEQGFVPRATLLARHSLKSEGKFGLCSSTRRRALVRASAGRIE
jgi:hypothetical protein